MNYLLKSTVLLLIALSGTLLLPSHAVAGKLDAFVRAISKLAGRDELQNSHKAQEDLIKRHQLNPESPTFAEDLRRAYQLEWGQVSLDGTPSEQPAQGLVQGPPQDIPRDVIRETAKLPHDANRSEADAEAGNRKPGRSASLMAVAAISIVLMVLLYRGGVLELVSTMPSPSRQASATEEYRDTAGTIQ